IVAYIINPVFAVRFMKPHVKDSGDNKKGLKISLIIFGVVIALSYLSGNRGLGNFAVLVLLLNLLNRFWLKKRIKNFQEESWPRLQEKYRRVLTWCLHR